MALTLLNLNRDRNADTQERAGMVMLDLADARAAESARQTAASTTAIVKQATNPVLFAMGGDAEDAKFKRITSKSTLRDLNPLMQERMQAVCFFLAKTTPFGKRIVEIITSYAVGEGFTPSVEDETASDVIRKFWKDKVNAMNRRLKAWSDGLCIFGEVCVPVFVNPVDGSVRLGHIDPQDIDAIEYGTMQSATGSDELAIPVAVRLKQRLTETTQRRLQIIRRDEDPNSATFGRLVGDCFYYKVNAAESASRGISELFSLADWIDVFDQMVFDFADRARFLNSFVWHYTIVGGDDKAVSDFEKKMRKSPPKQGGMQFTNEQVKIEAQTPDLKGADMGESARLVKLYGLGGAGLPAWFFADPVDSNRSTAQEMEGPTGKKLTDWQNNLKDLVGDVLDFVLDQAKVVGVLSEDEYVVTLTVPDLSIKDITRAATIMQATTIALVTAVDRGWIRDETAAKATHVMMEQIGVEVDAENEYDLAQKELQKRQADDANRINDQKNLAEAMNKLTGQPGGAAPPGDAAAAATAGAVQ